MDRDRDDAPDVEPHAPAQGPVPAVGLILPGTVQITAIAPFSAPDGQRRWRITLRGVLQADMLTPAGGHDLGNLDCELSFTTADPSLITQIRRARLRYVLDLIQLERQGDETGRVEDT